MSSECSVTRSEHARALINLHIRSNALLTPLSMWWHEHARSLPWRNNQTTSWGILVSEVMSQQTQMSRVVDYWLAWMTTWPTPLDVSQASPAEVITAWGRLGYPRRALRLQACASVVSHEYAGQLPQSYDELLALPGVGDYTASAVMSFAYKQRIVVIDTNIRRVLSRVFVGQESLGGSASRAERQLAGDVLPIDLDESVLWNQAIMELGALVCTAQKPQCQACPLRSHCLFLIAGLPNVGLKCTRPRQRFAGTNRQVRGMVLQALRDATSSHVSRDQVTQLWADHVQLDACLASLDEDGLIEMHRDGSISLPSDGT